MSGRGASPLLRGLLRLAGLLIVLGALVACSAAELRKPGWQRPVFYNARQSILTLWRTPLFDRGTVDFEPLEDGGVGVDRGEGLLFVGGRGKIFYSLSSRDGKILKKRKFNSEIFSRAVPFENLVILGTSDGFVSAMNKHTLEEVWAYRGKSEFVAPPVIEQGFLYVVSQNDTLTALDARTGKFLWEASEPFTGTLAIRRHAQPCVSGERVYQSYTSGAIIAYNRFTGEQVWRQALGRGARFDDANGTPVVQDGILYATSFDNGVYALNADNGVILWYTPLRSVGAPLLWDRFVLVTASEDGFYALDKAAGKIDWHFDLRTLYRKDKEGAFTRPQLYNDRYAIFTTSESGLYVLDLNNRQLVDRLAPGVGVSAEPTPSGRMIYFLSNGGAVHAVTLAPKGKQAVFSAPARKH